MTGVQTCALPISEEGITGRAYLFCYLAAAVPTIVRILDEVQHVAAGERVAPIDLWGKLARRFALIGVQGIVRMAMEEYSRRRHLEEDYDFVYTPHVTKAQLFEISGHLGFYKEGMFPPLKLDEEVDEQGHVKRQGADYYLKPMNCPFHNLVFRSRGRSYRDLPLRLFEFGTVYRYEKSGVVHGLTRARGFTQDEIGRAHV